MIIAMLIRFRPLQWQFHQHWSIIVMLTVVTMLRRSDAVVFEGPGPRKLLKLASGPYGRRLRSEVTARERAVPRWCRWGFREDFRTSSLCGCAVMGLYVLGA